MKPGGSAETGREHFLQHSTTASQRSLPTEFLAKMKLGRLRNSENTGLLRPTGTVERGNFAERTRHRATWGKTRQAGLFRPAVPAKNGPKAFSL